MRRRIAELGITGERARGIDLRPYIYDMPTVMAAADLIICRAGASTVSELTAVGKAAVLIPSPYVTNNHQEKNARIIEKAGGAAVLTEEGLTGKTLFETAKELCLTRTGWCGWKPQCGASECRAPPTG
jgi:UDP-N-acetylglucosamine--N-acetylmuramyl-(pentapeptide) pyrophosphoryl-undecaprenol N-acetylglucosamine transferase